MRRSFMNCSKSGRIFRSSVPGGGKGGYTDPLGAAHIVLDLNYRHLVQGLVFQHQHGAFVGAFKLQRSGAGDGGVEGRSAS